MGVLKFFGVTQNCGMNSLMHAIIVPLGIVNTIAIALACRCVLNHRLLSDQVHSAGGGGEVTVYQCPFKQLIALSMTGFQGTTEGCARADGGRLGEYELIL